MWRHDLKLDPEYKFRDSLQFNHRKTHENNVTKNDPDTFGGWLCDFLFSGFFVKCSRHRPSMVIQF